MFQASQTSNDLTFLNALVKVLQSLQANGGDMSDDNLWMGTDDENVRTESTDPPYSHDILRLLDPLRHLKRMKPIVDKLNAELDARIQSLHQECLPLMMADGIKRIPNEILVNIFHIGHRSTKRSTFIISIRATRSRHPNKILAFLDRSRQQDLSVTFLNHGFRPHMRPMAFHDSLLASSLRWTSLSIGKPSIQCIPVDLPLERVRILSFTTETTLQKFYTMPWKLPNLQKLYCTNAIPMFSGRTSSLLTFCSLSFSNWCFQLSQFMKCLPHLLFVEDFRLSFSDKTFLDHDSGIITPLTIMPTVQTFSVTLQNKTAVVTALLSRLVMAKLSRLVICCTDTKVATAILQPLRSSSPRCPFGTPGNIDVEILSAKGVDVTALLVEPLQSVRHLSIAISHAKFLATLTTDKGGSEDLREKMGSLQILRFVQCHQLLEQQVETLADNLLDNGSGRGLKLLEIFSCNSISEGFLKDMSRKLGDKISWRT